MRFLIDFIMPPLKNPPKLLNTDHQEQNENHYVMNLTNSNENSTKYTCSKYAPKVLFNLNTLRRSSRFCDVEIIAGGKVLTAHRAILAASSPYFHAMFTGGLAEQKQRSVELHSVAPNILEQLLEFIYTGAIQIDQNNVQELMVCADMLQLNEVVEGCTEYLQCELHASNAVGIYRFAEAHHFTILSQAAADFIHAHFADVSADDEWLELPQEQLVQFLASEQLRIESEVAVLAAAVRWVAHAAAARRRFVFDVLKHVRLPLLSPALLERTIAQVQDASLRVALRGVHADLAARRGALVALGAQPRRAADKHIYIIGGWQRESAAGWQRAELACTAVERFSVWRREWARCAPLAAGRVLPGVAALGGHVYVAGGEHDGRMLGSAERYDPRTDVWTPVAPMAVPRCEFGLCAVDGALYALGGWLGQDIGATIERYDPREDRWRRAGALPAPRFSAGAVSHRGCIYLVGGCSQHERHLSELLCFESRAARWRRLAPMQLARSQMGVAVLEGALYVAGGAGRQQRTLASVERYSFVDDCWQHVAPMAVARGCPAAAAADGLLYVVGGDRTLLGDFYRAQVSLATVECYDPTGNVWHECPPLPESRAEAGAVVI